MIEELARHIKALLAENDCVILPDLGGFMAQYVPACHVPQENMFMPPCRKVTFNTQLSLNDGLLVQAYMQAYDISYPQAMHMVDDAVSALRDQLAQEGEAKLLGIGTLRVTLDSRIEFMPEDQEIFSPIFYGFSAFEMLPLLEIQPGKETTTTETEKKNAVVISINRQWINTAVAAVVAIVLFFAWSAPVDNTYVEPENYACLGDARFFDNIRSQSVATTPVQATVCQKAVAAPVAQAAKKAVASKAEVNASDGQSALQESQALSAVETLKSEESLKDAQSLQQVTNKTESDTSEVTVPKSSKRYHIVIASAISKAEADKSLSYFASQGYPEATAIGSEGRIRVVLQSFDNKDEAIAKCNELRKQEIFSGAWVYASRN